MFDFNTQGNNPLQNAAIFQQGQTGGGGYMGTPGINPNTNFGIPEGGFGQPGVGGGLFGGGPQGGLSANNLQMGLSGIQTLGSMWMAFQQQKMAKEALKFQKSSYATNLKNQTQSYNTALEDRIGARYKTEGRSDQEKNDYIAKNKL